MERAINVGGNQRADHKHLTIWARLLFIMVGQCRIQDLFSLKRLRNAGTVLYPWRSMTSYQQHHAPSSCFTWQCRPATIECSVDCWIRLKVKSWRLSTLLIATYYVTFQIQNVPFVPMPGSTSSERPPAIVT